MTNLVASDMLKIRAMFIHHLNHTLKINIHGSYRKQ